VKILFINRVYPPAEGATGQLLADLAPILAEEGWQITVLTSRTTGALRSEIVNGIRLERVGASTFTRASHWGRALCYLTLYPALLWRSLRLPRADVVVTMTDPPLLLLLGPLLKGMKGCRLVHWAHDIYPEIAEELGVLSKGGWLAGLCRSGSTRALRQHDRIIVVGRCMKQKLLQRGLSEKAIRLVPNWASSVRSIEHTANAFRREHGLESRFVVMYSGNTSRQSG
jgi:glycosyltransferase involved in cell wall biosynthesis